MIRHGRTKGNLEGRYVGKTDEPLIDEELSGLTAYRGIPCDAVYVSPYLRCRQTAAILYPKQPHFVIPDFRECDFGQFEYKNHKELSTDPRYQLWIDSGGSLAFPGGESREEFEARCCRGFIEVIAETAINKWEHIAMVVHGGTIMAVLDAYGLPHRDYFDWQVGNTEGYEIRLDAESFADGTRRELIVDGRIVRR